MFIPDSRVVIWNTKIIIINTRLHNLMDAKCRWRSVWLDVAVSFREPLGQTKVIQIRQGETLNHQGAITHEVCCLAAQYMMDYLVQADDFGGKFKLMD